MIFYWIHHFHILLIRVSNNIFILLSYLGNFSLWRASMNSHQIVICFTYSCYVALTSKRWFKLKTHISWKLFISKRNKKKTENGIQQKLSIKKNEPKLMCPDRNGKILTVFHFKFRMDEHVFLIFLSFTFQWNDFMQDVHFFNLPKRKCSWKFNSKLFLLMFKFLRKKKRKI